MHVTLRSNGLQPVSHRCLAFLASLMFFTIYSSLPEPVWAELNDNTVKGAATNHVFSSGFGDSVDALTGQMHFTVPIGPNFAVSPRFSYQLQLVYTSKVWRYKSSLLSDIPRRLDGRGQAGVGFYLQLGRVFWRWEDANGCHTSTGDDSRSLIVQLADGTERALAPGSAMEFTTTDGSYIGAYRLLDPNGVVTGYRVRTPDGIVYEMDHWVDDPIYTA